MAEGDQRKDAAVKPSSPPAPSWEITVGPRLGISLPVAGRVGEGVRSPIASGLGPPWSARPRRSLAGRRGPRSGWRNRLAASLATAAATPSPPPATLVGWDSGGGLGTRTLRARWGDLGQNPRQTAQPAAAAGLLAGPRILGLDPLLELGQPFLYRPLDLRTRRSRLLGPDPRPVGSNGFRRWVGVGRLGVDRDFRREFRHQSKC